MCQCVVKCKGMFVSVVMCVCVCVCVVWGEGVGFGVYRGVRLDDVSVHCSPYKMYLWKPCVASVLLPLPTAPSLLPLSIAKALLVLTPFFSSFFNDLQGKNRLLSSYTVCA